MPVHGGLSLFLGWWPETEAAPPRDLYNGCVESSGVYRTGSGTVFRVSEAGDGPLKVEVLQDGIWVPGRIGMVGLRLAESTTKLGRAATQKLPV